MSKDSTYHYQLRFSKMMPLHQMPAANPEPEQLDVTSVKTIQTKVNNSLGPAVPVRTHTPLRAVPCGLRAHSTSRTDSLTTSPSSK